MRNTSRFYLSATLLLGSGLLLGACSSSGMPEPVTVASPEPPPASADREQQTTPAPEVVLRPVAIPEPSLPWLPPGVRWSPAEPREGDAIGIRLLQPVKGRPPVAVRGELAGRSIHFGRRSGGWYGIASAPIGSAGTAELVLRFEIGPDSTVVDRIPLEISPRDFSRVSLRVASRFSDPTAEALERVREEQEIMQATLATSTPDWLLDESFAPPRDSRVTSPFGQRRLFNGALRSRHSGVDLAGDRGAPVRAAGRGRVALTGDFYFGGKSVYLDHGLGVYTAYFHLSRIEIEEGEIVKRGETVGDVGATGRVTGPHLHWSLFVNGQSLDATSLIDLAVPAALPGALAADDAPEEATGAEAAGAP